jgi:hypothetical protein
LAIEILENEWLSDHSPSDGHGDGENDLFQMIDFTGIVGRVSLIKRLWDGKGILVTRMTLKIRDKCHHIRPFLCTFI